MHCGVSARPRRLDVHYGAHVASAATLLPTVIMAGGGLLINIVLGAAGAMFAGWFGGRLASLGRPSGAT